MVDHMESTLSNEDDLLSALVDEATREAEGVSTKVSTLLRDKIISIPVKINGDKRWAISVNLESRHPIFVTMERLLHGLCTYGYAASGDLHWEALLKTNLEAIQTTIPTIALSFVYQNVVPVVCTSLQGNLKKSLETNTDKITDPLQLLRSTNGTVGTIVEVFSLLAIGTSYIGFVLGLSDFLTDLLKLPSGQNGPLPYLLTLTPPLILSLLDPDIFFRALDFAGTYGVLVLFGILPAAMSWSDRSTESSISQNLPTLVPGGKLTLSLVIAASGFVIFSEILENLVHV